MGASIDLAWKELGIARFEQDVIEGDALVGDAVEHRKSSAPGPDRETQTTPHDVTPDLMTGKTSRQDRMRSGQASGAGQGRVSSVAFPSTLNPGWADLARSTGR